MLNSEIFGGIKIEIPVTQSHIDAAVKARKEWYAQSDHGFSGQVTRNVKPIFAVDKLCIINQALQGLGYSDITVGYHTAGMSGCWIDLDSAAAEITKIEPDLWSEVKPCVVSGILHSYRY